MCSRLLPSFLLLAIGAFTLIRCETIAVKPGDDIQAALNTLHSKYNGGTVLFNTGTYIIKKSLLIYSDITLKGEENSNGDITAILKVDPNDLTINEPILTNNDKPISNINLLNLEFIGNIQPNETQYPAYCLDCSRNCTGKQPTDPGCSCLYECPHSMRTSQLGVLLTAGGDDINTAANVNIYVHNLAVSHCSMGIHLKGWRNVTVHTVHLSENGMIQEYFHNMYLRRDFDVTISALHSYKSQTGNGINISQSSFITVFLSIFNDNYWRGLRIEGESGYVVHNIDVYHNQCNGDGDYGFRFANIVNGVVYNNSAANNKPTNLYDSNCKNVTFTNNQW